MNRTIFTLTVLLLISTTAFAHFPWLSMDKDEKANFCFGENPAEKNYKLPEPIAKAQVMSFNANGRVRKVALKKVESDDFIGMTSEKPIKGSKALLTKMTYGMYAGSRLDYYALHQAGPLPKDRKIYTSKQANKSEKKQAADSKKRKQMNAPVLDLQAQLVDTDKGVDVFVLWKGEPLADVDVTLFCEEGHEEGAATTDKDGKVSFTDKEVEDGLNGIMLGHKLEDDKGELDGKEYTSSSHYLTVTFHDPQDFE